MMKSPKQCNETTNFETQRMIAWQIALLSVAVLWLALFFSSLFDSDKSHRIDVDVKRRIDAFNTWARQLFDPSSNPIEAFVSPEAGIGARATRNIDIGDAYSSVPLEWVISGESARADLGTVCTSMDDDYDTVDLPVDADVRSAPRRAHYDGDCILFFLVKQARLGAASRFAPYIDLLPCNYLHVPTRFTEKELRAGLQASAVQRFVLTGQQALMQKFLMLQRQLKSIDKDQDLSSIMKKFAEEIFTNLNSKRLSQLPIEHQIGNIDAITYFLLMDPPILSFRSDLIQLLQDALKVGVPKRELLRIIYS